MNKYDERERRGLQMSLLRCVLLFMSVSLWDVKVMAHPLQVTLSSDVPQQTSQWSTVTIEFEIQGGTGNPYSPDDYDVTIELIDAAGEKQSHPAFYCAGHQIVFNYGHESVRATGKDRWIVRWTPQHAGRYSWTLIALSAKKVARQTGSLTVLPAEAKGFVRISQSDPRYFETADGNFFYPLGHHLRSPKDQRWQPPEKLTAAQETHKTLKYEGWFEKMQAHGENCCELWMSPWSLGLEWSPTHPGYAGIGYYNQIHAAQMDRIIELAEKHGIYIVLYTMNHGQLSTVIDAEWDRSPWNHDAQNGNRVTPQAVLKREDFRRSEEHRLRYILARWGYSPALMGLVLCSEIEWIDPYLGRQAAARAQTRFGAAIHTQSIPADPVMVEDWLARLAEFVKQSDIHGLPVTVHRNRMERDESTWSRPQFDLVLSNAYDSQLQSSSITNALGRPANGIADGIVGWSRHFSMQSSKPRLVAEWGGHHIRNSPNTLAAQLHVGIWSMAMTDLSGVMGFWWWNEIDQTDMYHHFAALARFLQGRDLRQREFRCEEARVLRSWQSTGGEELVVANKVIHPVRSGTILFDSNEAYIYVYHDSINSARTNIPLSYPSLFPEATGCYIELPQGLMDGRYEVEFWDPLSGALWETSTLILDERNASSRRLPLPNHRIDCALKLRRVRDIEVGEH